MPFAATATVGIASVPPIKIELSPAVTLFTGPGGPGGPCEPAGPGGPCGPGESAKGVAFRAIRAASTLVPVLSTTSRKRDDPEGKLAGFNPGGGPGVKEPNTNLMLPFSSTASPGCASLNSIVPPVAACQSWTVTSCVVPGGSVVPTLLKGITREVSCARDRSGARDSARTSRTSCCNFGFMVGPPLKAMPLATAYPDGAIHALGVKRISMIAGLWDRCCATRRRNHNPDRRQARHQIALNLARLAVESGSYVGVIDGRDANYDYEGKHYRVFDCRRILEERHRDPGLGFGIRGSLLEGHASEKILLDADCGGKETADQRIGVRRLPGCDEVGDEGRRQRVILGVQMERAVEHDGRPASRRRDRLRGRLGDVEVCGEGPDFDGNLKRKRRRRLREQWGRWHCPEQTGDTNSNRAPVSFHRRNPL